MTLKHLLVGALAGACLLAGAGTARAGCTIAVTGVNFGSYDVYHPSPLYSTGSITYECAKQDKRIRITLSRGRSPTFDPRTMKNGGEGLEYNLFTDAYATVWGDGTEGTGFYYNNNPPNNRLVALTVYGRVRPQQDVAYGLYGDTVVAQIEF